MIFTPGYKCLPFQDQKSYSAAPPQPLGWSKLWFLMEQVLHPQGLLHHYSTSQLRLISTGPLSEPTYWQLQQMLLCRSKAQHSHQMTFQTQQLSHWGFQTHTVFTDSILSHPFTWLWSPYSGSAPCESFAWGRTAGPLVSSWCCNSSTGSASLLLNFFELFVFQKTN